MGLFVKSRAMTPVNTKGKEVERIGHDVHHGQNTNMGKISGGHDHHVAASGQGHFNHSGKFPPGGNQEKPKNRVSFDVKPTGDAAAFPTGPQDTKQTLAEKNKKKRTAAQMLYPKHRSVEAVEAA
jgi:hypothetical protein